MNKTFKDLGINNNFVERLKLLNITTPTAIQELVIPKIIEGATPLILSHTGTGKSLAYLLPLLQRIDFSVGNIEMLILVPTRELAQQVGTTINSLCGEELHTIIIHGSVSYDKQIEQLKEKPSIIVATVGRLKDLISKGEVDINGIGCFVLDEVDQMLDMGFSEDVLELAKFRRENSTSCFASATMNEDILRVINSISPNIERLEVGAETKIIGEITQRAYYCEKPFMDNLLIHLLRGRDMVSTIIFTRSRSMADRLTEVICSNGLVAEAFHSERSQTARDYILSRFKSGVTPIIVATDVMSRGVDIEGVSHVINYGLPLNVELYIHRIGRTARAGNKGVALTICEPSEIDLLTNIQKTTKRTIEIDNSHPFYTSGVTKVLAGLVKNKKTKKKGRR